MLLTDQDYPRAYGVRDTVYYLVLLPDDRPVFVDGLHEDTYELVCYSGVCLTERTVRAHGYQRMSLPPSLAAKIPRFVERNHVSH